jgi:histidyl-tRNA synthetase
MSKIAAPRGTADTYPPESARWQTLEARVHAVARRFGYGEIRTPMFEATELFVRGVGETTDIVEKEMYTFVDKGGRSMTLRPEWTAPVVRALLEHNLLANGPQRLYYVGPFFRYERPQAGRYRQASQFGVECFGFSGPEADVEVMQLAHELLRSFRIPGVVLNVNSIGDEHDRPAYREALLAHFRPHSDQLSDDSQRRLERNPMRILDSKAPQDQPFIASAPTFLDLLSKENRAHFERVCELLESIGIAYTIDPRLVRGFDYYTRTVFQFDSDALGAQSTVCGGGRYDDLVRSLGGPPTPGVGFGLGLERFLMMLEKAGLSGAAEREGIAVIALGEKARTYLFPIAAALRSAEDGNAGVPIYADFVDAKIAAQFKRADRLLARAAIIAGEDEVGAGTVVVRDLIARSQETLGPFAGPHPAAHEIVTWYGGLPPAGDRISEAI